MKRGLYINETLLQSRNNSVKKKKTTQKPNNKTKQPTSFTEKITDSDINC